MFDELNLSQLQEPAKINDKNEAASQLSCRQMAEKPTKIILKT